MCVGFRLVSSFGAYPLFGMSFCPYILFKHGWKSPKTKFVIASPIFKQRQPTTAPTGRRLDSFQYLIVFLIGHFYELNSLTMPLSWLCQRSSFTESTKRLSMRKSKKSTKTPGNSAWANAASWLRRRREKVKAKHDPSSHDAQHQKVQRLASNLWSEAHQKEKDRSSCQVRKKRGLIQLKYILIFWPLFSIVKSPGFQVFSFRGLTCLSCFLRTGCNHGVHPKAKLRCQGFPTRTDFC